MYSVHILTKRWLIVFIIIICSCSKNNIYNNNSIVSEDPNNSIGGKDPRKITVLYTNDEHGWIEKSQHSNGAANMMGLWRDIEGYDGHESFLILSGGDNWLGPPISTLFKGESVVDVMNTMEYDASAIGNHEFEFNVANLYNRIMQANFQYLSANIRKKKTGKMPVFATPYIIKDINDIMVGIIGLSTIATPNTTVKDYVKDYEFIDYITALEDIVPQVKLDGAELLIVIAHICYSELIDLAPILIDMGISVVGGGHCHQEMIPQIITNSKGKLAVIQANSYMQSYAKVEILYDIIEKELIALDVNSHLNDEGIPDPNVERIVSYWKEKTERKLSEISSDTDYEIGRFNYLPRSIQ